MLRKVPSWTRPSPVKTVLSLPSTGLLAFYAALHMTDIWSLEILPP